MMCHSTTVVSRGIASPVIGPNCDQFASDLTFVDVED